MIKNRQIWIKKKNQWPRGHGGAPRVVSIYFIFSFHEYHQNLPNTSGFKFLIFRVLWIPSKVREYHLRQEPNICGFNFLIFGSHEYHPRFSSFSCQNIGEYHKNFQTTQWNPGHKIKKICAVFIETQHWWFFPKNTAPTFYIVFITNSLAHCLGSFSIFIFNNPLHISYLFTKF